MYQIDPRFYNEDGSINFEIADSASRKARAQAAGDGFRIILRMVRRMFHTGKHLSDVLGERLPSTQPLQDKAA